MSSTQPCIIIGMHRSGTSMITDILEQLGLYMGADLNNNQESMFFVHVNRWLLRQSGGDWDQPETVDYLIEDSAVRPLFVDFMRFSLKSLRVISYLGWQRYLRYQSPFKLDTAWGWKDPRTTFTLPLWLDLFPEARVIHIYRNGIDVASSLQVRGDRWLKNVEALPRWQRADRRFLYSVWPQLFPPFTTRHMNLETGFALWERYTRRADEAIAALPSEQTRVIQYEAFLENPLPVLQDLCDFVGLESSQAILSAAAQKINPARARAYEQDTNLMAFYEKVKSSGQMMRYNY